MSMKTIIALFTILFLVGCSAMGGGAGYKYSRINADGSTIEIVVDSTRIVSDADITIKKDGSMTIEVRKLDANAELAKAVNTLANKIPLPPL